ncbi:MULTISPECIES: pyrroline-5-carboxylate reductase [unclassified Janthinobacterium]|uniref:pyrroline-5-carboxylate reductase n=1 Tax=unclassified Janthinobacterium TaxID=2610881 RepID=UPI00161E4EB6|nr:MULTISPECIES: pyrroline-5-carboxylate reductase [unclassified Janthinobacterium]MBB5370509.1 pyrroline-5-carboxylate reductase [Janthinobacterium sp. K2C7]MBB5383277.1 pyrroline-5-carboxylate reductase [Janthinobacterium sp. K2Li3]MBB5388731.1 pyrroline-5-carboxylate reductase [Janthinobacterium sp. K2E3]
MTTALKIAFVGGGNMAAALIAGLAGKLTAGANIHVIDPHAPALEKLQAQFGVSTASSAGDALRAVDVIVLAVKPQSMKEVTAQLLPFIHAEKQPLVLSIAAGIRATDLSRWLGNYPAIVRCMPNTPALIGMGITGLVASSGVTATQKAQADAILQAVGATVWLDDEAQIDPVTAVSGSGPAYVFYFIEAMQQAASELGLTAEQGTQLAIATFTGAAQLAAQSTEAVSLLRERVTSKGGTTYAALTSMEESGVKAAIVKAVKAAAERGREMGDELGK